MYQLFLFFNGNINEKNDTPFKKFYFEAQCFYF